MPYVLIPVALVIILIIWVIVSYNNLVREQLKVDNQWSQINVQLKMRADVIPNLVETVSGYASHEKSLLNEVTQARTRFMSAGTPAETMKASGELSQTLGRLLAVSEAYPDLKANANFLNLQQQISEIEKRIADFRQFYNDTVMRYNRLIKTFPSNIVAGLFKFQEKTFLEVDSQDQVRPTVKFG